MKDIYIYIYIAAPPVPLVPHPPFSPTLPATPTHPLRPDVCIVALPNGLIVVFFYFVRPPRAFRVAPAVLLRRSRNCQIPGLLIQEVDCCLMQYGTSARARIGCGRPRKNVTTVRDRYGSILTGKRIAADDPW